MEGIKILSSIFIGFSTDKTEYNQTIKQTIIFIRKRCCGLMYAHDVDEKL